MKKIVCLSLALALLLFWTVGCASAASGKANPANPSKTAATVDKTRPVTLILIHYLAEKPKIQALQNMVNGFAEKNPNIKIDIQSMSLDQYINVLKMKLASGDAPNIMFGNPKSYMEVVNAGNALDITNQEFVKRIDPKFIANVTVNGKVYGVPLDLMPSGVYYNKDIFKRAGVEIPETWPDFIKVCKTLKAKGITPIAAGYKDRAAIGGACYTEIYGTPLSRMEDFREQVMTGRKKLADFPEFREFLERFAERNQYVNSDALQIGIDHSEQMFAAGRAAMIVLGSWGLGAIRSYSPDGNFGVFMFPTLDGDTGEELMSTATDDTFMICSHAGHQSETLKYFDYMTSIEAASKWADDVQVISAITGAKAIKLDPMAEDLLKLYNTGKIENWLAREDFYGQFNDIWMKKLQEFAFSKGVNIDQFIKGWDDEIDKARVTGR